MFLPRNVSKSRKIRIYIDNSVKALRLLTSLEVNKAVCVDAMSAKLLQTAAPGTRSHTALFSHSLDTGMVPCEWKSDNVCPVPKGHRSEEVTALD